MKSLLAAAAALSVKFLHCLAAGSNSLIGERQTGAALPPLGRTVTTYTCDTHHTFRVRKPATRVGLPAVAVTCTSSTRMMG